MLKLCECRLVPLICRAISINNIQDFFNSSPQETHKNLLALENEACKGKSSNIPTMCLRSLPWDHTSIIGSKKHNTTFRKLSSECSCCPTKTYLVLIKSDPSFRIKLSPKIRKREELRRVGSRQLEIEIRKKLCFAESSDLLPSSKVVIEVWYYPLLGKYSWESCRDNKCSFVSTFLFPPGGGWCSHDKRSFHGNNRDRP